MKDSMKIKNVCSKLDVTSYPVDGDEAVCDDVSEEGGDEDGDPLVGDMVAVRFGSLKTNLKEVG